MAADGARSSASSWGSWCFAWQSSYASKAGRDVLLVGGRMEYIPGAQWQAFLEQQKALLEARDKERAGSVTPTQFVRSS